MIRNDKEMSKYKTHSKNHFQAVIPNGGNFIRGTRFWLSQLGGTVRLTRGGQRPRGGCLASSKAQDSPSLPACLWLKMSIAWMLRNTALENDY